MQSPSSLPDPSNFPNDVQIGDGKHSYKDIASNNLPTIEFSMEPLPSEEENDNLDNDLISLSIEDKKYLYAPWNYSVIIKPFYKKFTQQYLKTKLEANWTPLPNQSGIWLLYRQI